MGLFSTDCCPICENTINIFKKTIIKVDNKFICKDCLQRLNNKGIDINDIKNYTIIALKNILDENKIEKEYLNTGKVEISEYILNISNANDVRKKYYAFDVETTGLDYSSDRIIELGVVLLENGVPIDSFSSLVNPDVKISAEATKVNNITDSMIDNAPKESEVYKKFYEFFNDVLKGKAIVCAHNASFDMNFLKNTLERLGYSGNIKYIDTLSISRNVLKNKVINYKQNTIASYFNIINNNSHRAVSDAETCGKILFNLIDLQVEKLEIESKQKEKLILSDSEKIVSSYFQKLIKDNFEDIELLGFRKSASGYIDMCYLYSIIRYKYTNKGFYIILPEKIANKLSLKMEACSVSEGGVENIRVYFNNPNSLESINDYIICEYKKALKEARSYMNQSDSCLRNAYESRNYLTVFDSNEMTLFNGIIDKMDLDQEVDNSIIKIDFDKVNINPINNRIPLEQINNLNDSDKGFEDGFIYWEKGEDYRKAKNFVKAIELYDKSRENGYNSFSLYESYSMAYHSLKDFENEISILCEGIKRLKKDNCNTSKLETRRNKSYENYLKYKELEQQKEIKEKEKKLSINEKKELEKLKEDKKNLPIDGRHILQLDDNGNILNEYISIAEAVRSTGVNSKSIRDAANGVQKHAGGYVWKYND